MKKIAIFALVLVAALVLAACGGNSGYTQLGTSSLSIVLPEGYASTEDNFSEDQVAYFYKDDSSIDFDVYQWAKGDLYTLEAEAKAYAAEYDTTAEAVTVNGLNGWKYVSVEDYEGEAYTVVNYMFEDDTYIVELAFWTVGTEAEYADVENILGTLKKN